MSDGQYIANAERLPRPADPAASDGKVMAWDNDARQWVATPLPDGGGGGTSDHAALVNLDYAGSGHTGFAPSVHAHAIGDVTGLQAALDGKQPAGSYVTSGVLSAYALAADVTTALAGKHPLNGNIQPAEGVTWHLRNSGGTSVMSVGNAGLGIPGNLDIGGYISCTTLYPGAGGISNNGVIPTRVGNSVGDAIELHDDNTGNDVHLRFRRKSSTTNRQDVAGLLTGWADATHATRRGYVELVASDHAGDRVGLRVEATGSGVRVFAPGLPTHADNAAAVAAGLAADTLYKTSGGELRVVV